MSIETEALRQTFKPERVRMLMVGESAPASGKFFYRANTSAYREISKSLGHGGDPGFLRWFKDQGYYLDDLVLEPINTARDADRRRACQAGVVPLAERIRGYAPLMVVAFKKSICVEVSEAVVRSRTNARYHCVRFPGNGQQGNFQDDMARILPLIRAL